MGGEERLNAARAVGCARDRLGGTRVRFFPAPGEANARDICSKETASSETDLAQRR